jgi:hypothetical protein
MRPCSLHKHTLALLRFARCYSSRTWATRPALHHTRSASQMLSDSWCGSVVTDWKTLPFLSSQSHQETKPKMLSNFDLTGLGILLMSATSQWSTHGRLGYKPAIRRGVALWDKLIDYKHSASVGDPKSPAPERRGRRHHHRAAHAGDAAPRSSTCRVTPTKGRNDICLAL